MLNCNTYDHYKDSIGRIKLQFIHLAASLIILMVSGCATNYVHPEFETHFSGREKITGLILSVKTIGIERGGLSRTELAEYESLRFISIMIPKLFTAQQMQWMEATPPEIYIPQELILLGYEQSEADYDTKLLSGALEKAITVPDQPVTGDELEAVRRMASRTGGDFVLLGEVSTIRHISDKSRSFADFLAILAAAGGQYGVTMAHDKVNAQYAIIDPTDGKVMRTLKDSMRIGDLQQLVRRESYLQYPRAALERGDTEAAYRLLEDGLVSEQPEIRKTVQQFLEQHPEILEGAKHSFTTVSLKESIAAYGVDKASEIELHRLSIYRTAVPTDDFELAQRNYNSVFGTSD